MGNKKLTLKQKDYAKKFVELRNGTQAAFMAYPCKNRKVAAVMAKDLNKNPKVRAEIERLLLEVNLTEELVVKRLREGLNANVVSIYEGQVDESEVPDLTVRHKYVQEAAKIMDLYPPQRSESRSINLDLELEKMSPQQIEALLRGMIAELNGQSYNKKELGPDTGNRENVEAPESQK